MQALFDVRVTDTDAPSYFSHSVADVLAMAEMEKLHKCGSATETWCTLISPFVISVDDAMGHETRLFLNQSAGRLSASWGEELW